MRFNNAAPGVVLILFALAEIAYTKSFPRLHGQDYGPDLFPILIGVGLIVCGFILIIQGIAQRARVPLIEIGDWAQDQRNIQNVGILLASIVFLYSRLGQIGIYPHIPAYPNHASAPVRIDLAHEPHFSHSDHRNHPHSFC